MLTAKEIKQVQEFEDDLDYIRRNGFKAFQEECERRMQEVLREIPG